MNLLTSCTRKRAYPDEAAARAALAQWRADAAAGLVPKITGSPRPFRCPAGRHWHLGTRKRGARAQRRR